MCFVIKARICPFVRPGPGVCLGLCYDTQSLAMPSTLNNPQNVGAEYLKATFPVNGL